MRFKVKISEKGKENFSEKSYEIENFKDSHELVEEIPALVIMTFDGKKNVFSFYLNGNLLKSVTLDEKFGEHFCKFTKVCKKSELQNKAFMGFSQTAKKEIFKKDNLGSIEINSVGLLSGAMPEDVIEYFSITANSN